MTVFSTLVAFPNYIPILLTVWAVLTVVFMFRINRNVPQSPQIVVVSKEVLEARYQERKQHYSDDLAQLKKNVRNQAALILIAIALALRPEGNNTNSEMDIPGGVKVPLQILYWVLPVGALYFWCECGFLLNRIIINRLALWDILEFSHETDEGPLSRAPLLRDNWLVDAYCFHFHPRMVFSKNAGSRLSRIYLPVIILFFASTHTVALGGFWTAALLANNDLTRGFFVVAFLVALFFFSLVHLQFISSIGGAIWPSYSTVTIAYLFTMGLFTIVLH